MRKRIGLGAFLITLTATAGCASLRVGSDFDRDVSFANRHTYDWVEAAEEEREEAERVNPFLERRLQRAVDRELEALGFRQVEEGEVDLLVAVSVLDAEEGVERSRGYGVPLMVGLSFGYTPSFWYPWGSYWGSYWGPYRYRPYIGYGRYRPLLSRSYFGYPYGYASWGPYGYAGRRGGDLQSLAPGSFVIDIFDGESGDLIWRGWANGALAYAPDVDDLPEFIDEVVHDILEAFPPRTAR